MNSLGSRVGEENHTPRMPEKTGQVHSDIDEEVSLLDLSIDHANRVVAQLGYKNFIFYLRLTSDGLYWISA